MTEDEYDTFERAYKRAAGVYQQRWKGDEDVVRTYFRLLEGWPLDAVLRALKTACQTIKHFPKPAELVELLERTRPRDASGAAGRQMTVIEMDLHARAAALGYHDEPCGCFACVEAGVSDQPVRFVLDDLDDRVEDRPFNPQRKQREPIGHWAHGHELARWYAAREAFFRMAPRRVRRVLRLLTAAREPGEEG